MIAIAGGKGGSGKTTTTLGLAAAIASRGERAVAVDADRDMPDLHAMAGVQGEPTLATAAVDLDAAIRQVPSVEGAAVVPAGPDDDREDLRGTLRAVRRMPARGLVDCPAGAGPDAVAPLRAADRVVVVATPTPAGLRDAVKTAAVARSLETSVAVAALTRAGAVPDGVEGVLDLPAVAVPEADGAPFARETRTPYRRILAHLEDSRPTAPAPHSRTGSRGRGHDRPRP